MQILDELLPRVRTREDLRMRARLAEGAHATSGALATWMELARFPGAYGLREADATSGRLLLHSDRTDALGPEERDAWLRDFDAVERSAAKTPRRR